MPLPRVTKPLISSGGAGRQHRASWVSNESTPTTKTPPGVCSCLGRCTLRSNRSSTGSGATAGRSRMVTRPPVERSRWRMFSGSTARMGGGAAGWVAAGAHRGQVHHSGGFHAAGPGIQHRRNLMFKPLADLLDRIRQAVDAGGAAEHGQVHFCSSAGSCQPKSKDFPASPPRSPSACWLPVAPRRPWAPSPGPAPIVRAGRR